MTWATFIYSTLNFKVKSCCPVSKMGSKIYTYLCLAISFDRLAFYASPVQGFSETKREDISRASFQKY